MSFLEMIIMQSQKPILQQVLELEIASIILLILVITLKLLESRSEGEFLKGEHCPNEIEMERRTKTFK